MFKLKSKLMVAVMVMFGITAFMSCKKQGVENLNDESNCQISERGTVTIVVSWTEWGRKKKNCDGGGLCNFKVEKIEYEKLVGNVAPILHDSNGNPYIEALVNQDLVFEDESKSLYIDEEIRSIGPNGLTYSMRSGVYKINYNLGEFGGYKIPLTIK